MTFSQPEPDSNSCSQSCGHALETQMKTEMPQWCPTLRGTPLPFSPARTACISAVLGTSKICLNCLSFTTSLNQRQRPGLCVLLTSSHMAVQENLYGLSAPILQCPPQCLAWAHLSAALEVLNPLTEFSQDPSLISASHPHVSNKNRVLVRVQTPGCVGRGHWDTTLVPPLTLKPDPPKLPDANGMHLGL